LSPIEQAVNENTLDENWIKIALTLNS
jgi:hypothetical protein